VAELDFDWQIGAQGQWNYRDARGELRDLPGPALAGEIQYRNAATALCAVRSLPASRTHGLVLDQAQAALGLSAARLQGRMQIVPGPTEWLLDVAHNPPAAAVLVAALRERRPARRTRAVFGMLADKDVGAVAALLEPLVDGWLLCGIDDARGLGAAELRTRMGDLRGASELCASVGDACERARQQSLPGDRVLICGSFHVVGPALDWLGL
jgi:dihydrofolate synthase / folylpolyglutamate synthase